MLTVSNQTEETVAEPGADYVPASGSLILEEGETSVAINITILEVTSKPFNSVLVCMISKGNILETKACSHYLKPCIIFHYHLERWFQS